MDSISGRRTFFCFLISCQVMQCSLLFATPFGDIALSMVGQIIHERPDLQQTPLDEAVLVLIRTTNSVPLSPTCHSLPVFPCINAHNIDL